MKVRVYDLRVGDMTAGDSTVLDTVERIGNTNKWYIAGVCHGVGKERIMEGDQEIALWIEHPA